VNLSNIRINSSHPLNNQIKNALLSAIDNSDISPGEKIPSLEDLSQRYGVNRMTARQAGQELVREGRLYTVIGKGTFVSKKTKIEPPMNSVWGFSDSFSSTEGDNLSRLLSMEILKPDDEIAEKLKISKDNKIYKLSRLRLIDQKPVAVEFSHLPFDRFPNLDQYDWNSVSLYATLCKTYKVKLSHGKQFVEAGCASSNIASLLEVQPKSPVLIMDRLIESDKGWHVEYAHTYYRADCIRLLIQMSADEPITLVRAESSK